MKNKYIYIGLGVATVLGIGGYVLYRAVKKDKAAIKEDNILTTKTDEPAVEVTDKQGGGDGFTPRCIAAPCPSVSGYSPIRSDYDKTWDYQLRNGVWYAKKKAGGTWTSLSLFPTAIKNLYSKYPRG
mgnify:CR=1 FL=1